MQLMHSQMTDHAMIEEIVAEAGGARLLVSTVTTQKPISQNGAPAPVIAMHSLSPADAGFLAPLPSSSLAPQRTDGGTPYKRCPHVRLHRCLLPHAPAHYGCVRLLSLYFAYTLPTVLN